MPDASRRTKPTFSMTGKVFMREALDDKMRKLPGSCEGPGKLPARIRRSWVDQGFVEQRGNDFFVTASGANAFLLCDGAQ